MCSAHTSLVHHNLRVSDGHRRCVVEHTLNVLFLPGLHSHQSPTPAYPHALTSDEPRNPLNRPLHVSLSSASGPPAPSAPGLPLFGTDLTLPSPLHLQLHVFTRLSFNEQGRITHHRDIWDIKDIIALFPGGTLSQWIASRLAAKSLSIASNLGAWVLGGAGTSKGSRASEEIDEDAARRTSSW